MAERSATTTMARVPFPSRFSPRAHLPFAVALVALSPFAAAPSACVPSEVCPPCQDTYNATLRRTTGSLPAGHWEIRVDTDLGKGRLACVVGSELSCTLEEGGALLDYGSVEEDGAVRAIIVTIHGTPRRAKVTALHEGTQVGELDVATIGYERIQTCGGTCSIAKGTLAITP
jgi:hypothetical protein